MKRIGRYWQAIPTPVRAGAVGLLGGMLIVAGVVMLVLPGPGLVVIALGLGVLATEFAWARRVVARGRKVVTRRR